MRPHIAAGTKMKVLGGPFASYEATIVNDAGGETLDADISIFGRVTRMQLRLEDLGIRVPVERRQAVEPRFDVSPPVDFTALFASPNVQQTQALLIRSGEILAFDPTNLMMFDTDYAPFATRVKPGLYPVLAFVARDLNVRVKAVLVRFQQAPIVRWRVATPFAAEVARIAEHYNNDPAAPYRYECLGTGGLVDAEAMRAARARFASISERVVDMIATQPFASLEIGEAGENLLAFKAHDGHPCASWWGEAEDGTIAALACDLFQDDYAAYGI